METTINYILTYYINYNSNGGSSVSQTSNSITNTTGTGIVTTQITTTIPTRRGYVFLGWWDEDTKVTSTSLNYTFDSNTIYSYDDATHAHASHTITLTAHWSYSATVQIVNSSGELDTYKVYVVNSSGGLDAYRVCVVNSSGGLDPYY